MSEIQERITLYESYLNDMIKLFARHDLPVSFPSEVIDDYLNDPTTFYGLLVKPKKKKWIPVIPLMLGSYNRQERSETYDIELSTCRGLFLIGGTLKHVPTFVKINPERPHSVTITTKKEGSRKRVLEEYVQFYRYVNLSGCKVMWNVRTGKATMRDANGKDYSDHEAFVKNGICDSNVTPQDLNTFFTLLPNGDNRDNFKQRAFITVGHLFYRYLLRYVQGCEKKQHPTGNKCRKIGAANLKKLHEAYLKGMLSSAFSLKTIHVTTIGNTNQAHTFNNTDEHKTLYEAVSVSNLHPSLCQHITKVISKTVKRRLPVIMHRPSQIGMQCMAMVTTNQNIGRRGQQIDECILYRSDTNVYSVVRKYFPKSESTEDDLPHRVLISVNNSLYACCMRNAQCVEETADNLKRDHPNYEVITHSSRVVVVFSSNVIPFTRYGVDGETISTSSAELQSSRWSDAHPQLYCRLVTDIPYFNHDNASKLMVGLSALKNAVFLRHENPDGEGVRMLRMTREHRAISLQRSEHVREEFLRFKTAHATWKGATQLDAIAMSNSAAKDVSFLESHVLKYSFTSEKKFPKGQLMLGENLIDWGNENFTYRGTLSNGAVITLFINTSETLKLYTKEKERFDARTHKLFIEPFSRFPSVKEVYVMLKVVEKMCILSIQAILSYDLMVGHKLCTRHGQKGIICSLDDDLPYGIDSLGRRVNIEVLLSPFSITSRGIFGQLHEMKLKHGGEDMKIYNSKHEYLGTALVGDLDFICVSSNPEEKCLYSAANQACLCERTARWGPGFRSGGARMGCQEIACMEANGLIKTILHQEHIGHDQSMNVWRNEYAVAGYHVPLEFNTFHANENGYRL